MENLNRIKGALADAGKTGVWLAGQLGKDPVTVSKWCTIMGDVLLLGGREIICNWDIDCNVSKYEHIIEQRIERFPDRYDSTCKRKSLYTRNNTRVGRSVSRCKTCS